MNKKLKRFPGESKGKKIGLFIDNANWFYPQKELGWDIDFERLLTFLKKYYKIEALKLYAGTPLDFNSKASF